MMASSRNHLIVRDDGQDITLTCCCCRPTPPCLFGGVIPGFVNCLVKQFAMCLGVVDILLLNVMDVFSVGGGALLDRLCMNVRVVPLIPMCI